MKHWLTASITLLSLIASSATAGEIRGVVLGHDGKAVPHVTVVLCDQATGIPVSKTTFKPFIEGRPDFKSLAVAVGDENGAFRFENVLEGTYRLVAQSWRGASAVDDVFEKNGEEILLRGVQGGVVVPSEEAKKIALRPLGNCVVELDEDFPNNEGMLLVSTAPLSTDSILGFVAWRGPFLQNMIGANRMPYGVTKIGGLPETRIHLSVFAVDSNGGFGAGSVAAIAGETVQADYIPIVCGWSNGRHDPPEELKQTFSELKQIAAGKQNSGGPLFDRLLAENGITIDHTKKPRNPMSLYYDHLDEVVSLPSGSKVRFADVLACAEYMSLQRNVERRWNKAKAGNDK